MDWLNLHISVLDSPQVLRCDPVHRATWLFLLRYCIGQENGGLIADCRSWGDTTWQQLARVKLREVNATSQLWAWEGDNLRVTFYPSEKETEVRHNRENGKRGGRPKRNRVDNHMVSDRGTTRFDSAETERKGREGEEEGKGITPAVAAAHTVDPPPPPREELHGGEPRPHRPQRPRTFATWRIEVGKRVFVGESEEDAWRALFDSEGWDEMTRGYEHLTKTHPQEKIFLSQFQELR